MKADIILRGKIVNVYTGEILEESVAIKGDRIYCMGENLPGDILEFDGYLLPGLMDGHIHIESSKLRPVEFAKAVVPRGTTSVFADPHEIVNVAGKSGFAFMIEDASKVPLRFHFLVPSCVPASPLDESPFKIGPDDVADLLEVEDVVGLAEVMDFPGVVRGNPNILSKIKEALKRGKPVDGHAPLLTGQELCEYIYRGAESDHECTRVEEALEKLRKGMYVMLREGTASKDLWIVSKLNVDRRRVLLVSDDRSATDLLKLGHIDHLLRRAVEEGLDPVEAVQMVTLNVAERFGLKDLGGIAPGKKADLVIVRELKRFEAIKVFIDGNVVASNGKPLFSVETENVALGVVKLPPLTPEDLSIRARGSSARVKVIELTGSLLTEESEEWLPVTNGFIRANPEADVLQIAVIERYGKTGNLGKGFVRGFGFEGAIASTVAHDSHNLIVVGSNARDMLLACIKLQEVGGGQVIVSKGRILGVLPLPIGGLMSNSPVREVSERETALIRAYRELGGKLEDPFIALSFLA
ncbi:MAG: adenine deaminase, partial [Thermoproteota archaeon]